MAKTESRMVELGAEAPEFALVDVVRGEEVRRDALMAAGGVDGGARVGLLVMFVCVHCPYVQHMEAALGALGRDYLDAEGAGPVAIVAVQSNDVAAYPQDGPEGMRAQAARLGWRFPYLLDATQEVARAFDAACTPDFFLYRRGADGGLRLVYRGQFDGSRPRRGDAGNDEPVTGVDLRRAMDAVIAGREIEGEQRGSLGCNIKWREA